MQLLNKKIPYAALFIACGILCGYIEYLFPLPIGIPGVKLGLSNIVTVICLYLFDPVMSIIVLFVRVLLSGFMFGNAFGIIYSLSGAVFSFLIMLLLKRFNWFSVTGISVAGGVTHNIGQLLVACFLISQLKLIYYLPILIISGVLCGFIVGFLSDIIIRTLKKMNMLKGI